MHIVVVGLSHRTAPVTLRERVDFQGRVEPALRALASRGSTHEAAVLSTCNRAELYAACDEVEVTRGDLTRFLSEFHRVEPSALQPHVYDLADLDAVRHLLRVAAGLDSLVVGEPQILGQVKEAHALASAAQTVGPVLNRLFHSSFAAGKRVRTDTGLASGAVSVSYAAVALARKIFGDLKGRNVLVIGAGEMGKLTAQHMKSQGVNQVTIVSRTMAHAARAAEAIGGASAAPWEEMDAALASSDIVITATGAGTTILTKAHVETVMRSRRSRPLFIIDIAMPRDVEAMAGEIEQVFLYNIDDLQATVRENLARRASEVLRAESIVSEEVGKFASWLRSRDAIPTVVALRQKFENIRLAELDRLEFKLSSLPREARPEARACVDEITRLIVEKLLLTPTEQLKALGDRDTLAAYSEALTRLFSLNADAEQDSTAPSDRGSEETDRRRSESGDGRVEAFRPKSRPSSGSRR
jgi:glutamyl-tRNA reductase